MGGAGDRILIHADRRGEEAGDKIQPWIRGRRGDDHAGPAQGRQCLKVRMEPANLILGGKNGKVVIGTQDLLRCGAQCLAKLGAGGARAGRPRREYQHKSLPITARLQLP